MQTLAFIVCSPTGRVGKTTIARLLADYFALGGRPFRAFDTDPRDSNFALRFPDEAVIADLAKIEGQMALFDGLLLNDGTVKIVDLWHRFFETFTTVSAQIGFIAEAERRGILPIFVFVVDASPQSYATANALARECPEAMMIAVSNEGAAPLGANVLDELDRYPTARTFEIPPLDAVLRAAIDEPEFSMSRFLLAPPTTMSIVVRAGLRTWINRIFAQFRNFELRLAMDSARYLR